MLEQYVYQYWLASCKLDRDIKLQMLSCIRQMVQPFAEQYGYQWTDKVERTLIDSALNFSSSWRVSFLEFFLRKLADLPMNN